MFMCLYKVCNKCGVEYPAITEYFHENKRGKYGLQSSCKVCRNKQARDYYNENTEQCRESSLNCYHKNKDKYREKRLAYFRKRYQENRETLIKQHTQWAIDNPIKARNIWARRKARVKKATIGKVDYTFILERDKSICHICGKKVEDYSDIHFDHVIPIYHGGLHCNENIAVSHAKCNLMKGTKIDYHIS